MYTHTLTHIIIHAHTHTHVNTNCSCELWSSCYHGLSILWFRKVHASWTSRCPEVMYNYRYIIRHTIYYCTYTDGSVVFVLIIAM